jgi:prophage DNA circulation protein
MLALLEERAAVLREQIDAASVRLADIAEQVARDGLTVTGSEGQSVAHKLLAAERAVQKSLRDAYAALQDVTRQLENARLVDEANAITAWRRTPPA